ncbi:MAG: phosphoglucosamine mutase [Lachnospiraceae bacterium]|nr:phosphoglucosamine mutase [Lachnospiraceae bacterium]
MGKYFGTDGFRGKAGVVLTSDHAYKTGRFLGMYYGKEKAAKIVIGMDTRRSGDMLSSSLCAGITASGGNVYLLNVTTTPCVSFITRTEGFDCGIMISASHNPFFDNGIKLMNSDGEKMRDDVQGLIEKYIDGEYEEIPFASEDKIGTVTDYKEGISKYIEYLKGIAPFSFKGHKVALDCANGSASFIGPEVFKALGAEIVVMGNTPDGVNINAGVGSTHLEALQKFVVENGCEAGLAFDGDADRFLAVDEKGEQVNGDKVMYICGKYLHDKGRLKNNTVVTTIMSNFGLYKAFEAAGISYEKTDVGDKYVYENMKANDHILGGEQSGHVIFREYARTGDGLVTAIKLMEVMLDTGRTLSDLAYEVTMFPQVLKNVEVDDKDLTLNDPAVKASVEECTKALGADGRVLLRKSGTEPVLRVMAEAATKEDCEKYTDLMIEAMKKSGHLIKVR